MVKEDNYFTTLMRDHGFDCINESLVKFLNKHMRNNELELNYRFSSIRREKFLKYQDYSPVAFECYSPVSLKSLDYESVKLPEYFDDTVAWGPIFYKEVIIDGESFSLQWKKLHF